MPRPQTATALELCSQDLPLNPAQAARNYEVHGYTVIAKVVGTGERVIGVRNLGRGLVRLSLEGGGARTVKSYAAIKLDMDYTPQAAHPSAQPIMRKYQTIIPLSGGGARIKGLTSPNPKEWTPETKAQVEKYLSHELRGDARISDRSVLFNGKQVGHIGAHLGEIVAKINDALMTGALRRDWVAPPERTGNLAEEQGAYMAAARPAMRKEAKPQGEWRGWDTKGGKLYERIYADDAGVRWIAQITDNGDGTFDAMIDSPDYQDSERGIASGPEARQWITDKLKRMAKRLGKRFGSVYGDTEARNVAFVGAPISLRDGPNTALFAIPVEYIDANGKRQKRTVEYDLTFEWEGAHVVEVERPDQRKITQALSAKQIVMIDYPTAMEVERALQGNTVEDESFAYAAKPGMRKRAPKAHARQGRA